MPKINIKEVDNTQPGTRAYSNYTVVVPGFHTPYTDLTEETVFGTEGIVEINSQSAFEKLIGIVPPKEIPVKAEETKSITITEKHKTIPSTISGNTITYTGAEGSPFTVAQNLSEKTITYNYKYDEETTCTATFKYEIQGQNMVLYTTESETLIPVDSDKAYVVLNSDLEIIRAGFVTSIEITSAEGVPSTETKILKVGYTENIADSLGYLGYFEIEVQTETEKEVIVSAQKVAHYGNQIAYELLGLGYTVFYVNMGELDIESLDLEDPEDAGCTSYREALNKLGDNDFWMPLRDKTTYDFRFVLTGFVEGGEYQNKANTAISTLAGWVEPKEDEDILENVSRRGDCLALIDLDEGAIRSAIETTTGTDTIKRTINAIKAEVNKLIIVPDQGKYSEVTTPSVVYADNLGKNKYNNSRLPASFHYLACFANSVFNLGFSEWFAIGGFTRGVSAYKVEATTFNLGDIAVNALEPRYKMDKGPEIACNVIVNNRGNYYIWGNRTAHKLGKELTASHFLNIRQLCISIKKFVYNLCRNFTFDPNSDVLWNNFVVAMKPLLETMKSNQGIESYKIEKVATSRKGVLAAKIRIVPIEAVEDFDIEISLEDSLGTVTATVTE